MATSKTVSTSPRSNCISVFRIARPFGAAFGATRVLACAGHRTRSPLPSTHVGSFQSFQHGVKHNVEGLPAVSWFNQKARQTQVACNALTILHFASNHFICSRAHQQHDVSSTRRLRAWKTNLLQVLQAVLFVFVIWAVDKAITYSRERMPAFSQVRSPSATAVASIPDCTQNQYLKACSHIMNLASCCFKALLLLTASSCASLDYAVTCWLVHGQHISHCSMLHCMPTLHVQLVFAMRCCHDDVLSAARSRMSHLPVHPKQ